MHPCKLCPVLGLSKEAIKYQELIEAVQQTHELVSSTLQGGKIIIKSILFSSALYCCIF